MLRIILEQSHTKSFNTDIQGAFKIQIIPLGAATKASNMHYIIVLDTSGSMYGEKMDKAKQAATELVKRISPSNYLSLITFSNNARLQISHVMLQSDNDKYSVTSIIKGIEASGSTAFYQALRLAIELSKEYKEPSYAIILTDGIPTDVTDINAYRELPWPKNLQALVIGVGLDYNPELLTLLADKSGGLFIHIDEHSIDELLEHFRSVAVDKMYASDIRIRIKESIRKARFVGYEDKEISIPTLSDENLEILGEVEIPAMYSGTVAAIEVEYYDPRERSKMKRLLEYHVTPAKSREEYLAGINKNVFDEYLYYTYVEEAKKLSLRGDLVGATMKLKSAEQVAARTMRLDLVTETRQLITAVEQTKKLGGQESATRKLTSMATRTLRRK